MIIRGAGHLHTTFSSDGRLSLRELSDSAKKRGLEFLLLSDHGEDINRERYAEFVEECEDLSGPDFIVIPGLEFFYEDYVHLLGVGLYEHPGLHPLSQQIQEIKGLGGLAVLAHANTCKSVPYEDLRGLDGVEAWNSRYGGRIAPRTKDLKILNELRGLEGRSIPCFSGLDFHEPREFRGLTLEVEVDGFSREALLKALKGGNFLNRNRWFSLGALERPGVLKRLLFAGVDACCRMARTIKKHSRPRY